MNGTLYNAINTGGPDLCPHLGMSDRVAMFSVDPKTGAEEIIYFFKGDDAADRCARPININGVLYCTTMMGGGEGCQGTGCETVFAIRL